MSGTKGTTPAPDVSVPAGLRNAVFLSHPDREAVQPLATSWGPVDLRPVLAGEAPDDAPAFLTRADGPRLLYAGKLHQVAGEPEAGKGWFACLAVVERLAAGERAVYIDFEDSEVSIVARLRALGATDEALLERFAYVRPHEPLTNVNVGELTALLYVEPPALVVVDGVTEALTIHGLDLSSNADIARWLELLPRVVTRAGAACLLVDHVTKDRETRARFAIGAQHKLAGIDVAYGLEVVEPFGRGRSGEVKVVVAKDRPGHVRQHEIDGRIADMHLTSSAEGAVTVELRAPDAAAEFRPTVLMGRISEVVEADPGLSTNSIERGVKGKTDAKRHGLRLLIAEGYIDARQEGNARCHYSLRPFVETADLAPSPQPRPNLAPANPTADLAPSPLPSRGSEARGEANGETETARPRPPTCTCPQPAPSPRSSGQPVCATCRQPIREEAR